MKIPKSDGFIPNTWRHWQDRDFVNHADVRTAVVTCPTCRNPMSLKEHNILDNGTVLPSLVCPTEACTFHEFVTLEEWNPND